MRKEEREKWREEKKRERERERASVRVEHVLMFSTQASYRALEGSDYITENHKHA